MKILHCHTCDDVFRVTTKERLCSCGKSGVLCRTFQSDTIHYFGDCGILFAREPVIVNLQKIDSPVESPR